MSKISIDKRIEQFVEDYKLGIASITDEIAYLKANYKTTTVACYVTKYRKQLTKEGIDCSVFKLDLTHYKGIQTDTLLKVTNKLSKKKSISIKSIEQSLKVLKEDGLYGKICYLGLVTGRRLIEIVSRGCFKELPSQPYDVEFSGLAKQRTSRENIIIPIMVSYKEFHEVFTDVRKCLTEKFNINDLNNVTTTNLFCKPLQRYLQKNSSNLLVLKLINSYKDFRVLYGNYMCLKRKPNEVDSIIYIGNILGHKTLDVTTPLHYKTIHVY